MRLPRRFAPVLLLGFVSWGSVHLAGVAQPPTLPSLLGAAAAYVSVYEEQASTIVFEEDYVQRVTRLRYGLRSEVAVVNSQERRLRAEVVVVNTGDLGWIGFRDVFEVDGKTVQDRQGRLQKLFLNPLTEAAIGRARAVADESARFNLGSVQRNLNYPTMALMFLRDAHQSRSTFSRESSARVAGVATWMVRFQEVGRPTLIGSRLGDVVTSGRFWIEPDSGRVRRSQISIDEAYATGTFDVEYGSWPGLDVLVPVSMEENISVRAGDQRLEPGLTTAGDIRPVEVLRGEARYSKFKVFRATARIKVSP